MTDEASTGPQWNFGDIANGHILVVAGWVPLRPRVTAEPPYDPGDVVNGHAFTGQTWVPVPASIASPQPQPPAVPPRSDRNIHTFGEKKPNWFMRLSLAQKWMIGGAVAALGIAIALLQPEPAGLDAQEDFRVIVSNYQFKSTDNDAQVVAAKRARGNEICDVLPADLAFEGGRELCRV